MLNLVHDAEASKENTTEPVEAAGGSLLDQIVRDGARQMLAAALQAEVAAYVERFAEALGAADSIGTVEPGKLADLLVVGENPLANLKVLYGTGHIRLGDDGKLSRVGGVELTIKDGIVFDAKELLQDVKRMVSAEKKRLGITALTQP